jgi:membrane dipeptidase
VDDRDGAGSAGARFGAYDFGLPAGAEARAARLHAASTIVDVIWWGPVAYRSFTPEMDVRLRAMGDGDLDALMRYAQRLPGRMAVAGEFPEFRTVWDASGVTAGHYEVQVGDAHVLLEGISHVDHLLDNLPWLRKALRADDFRRAKREGGHAFYLQCQPTPPISRDFGLVDLAYDGGLRILQLAYNVQDAIAVGCTESSAGGVSRLGASLIARLNDLGVLVDVSHCNHQSVMDACRLSERPVIVSHTGAAGAYPHDRGISDEAAEAVVATGGFIGVVTVPYFLGTGATTMDTMLDHIDHFARLVGPEHLAIATDWPMAGPKWMLEKRRALSLANGFRPEHGNNPTQNLIGFDDYRDFPNITRGLVARGYTDEQIRGILGENFLRVFASVCG